MEDNEFVSDSELTNYINFAVAELHDLLVQCYGSDYFLNSTSATTTVDTTDYSLPSDFYKLRGVDVKLSGNDWLSIQPFNFNERNRFEDFGSWSLQGITNIRYRIMGSNIKFSPVPDSQVDYRIWYVPTATKLSADTDSLDDINQYSNFVIVTAAIKMLNKEESDISNLAGERQRLINHIEEVARNRDAANPESISDIHAENNDSLWYTSRG
jgi:hypothetical protein